MRRALLQVDGVVAATASYDDKRADIAYRPDVVAPEALVKAIDEIGFEASVMEPEAPPRTASPEWSFRWTSVLADWLLDA